MRHVFDERPPYDCIADSDSCPEKCGGRRGHGRHGGDWFFAVVSADGRSALHFTVYPHNPAPKTEAWTFFDSRGELYRPMGVQLFYHRAFAIEDDEIRHGSEPGSPCEYLGKCFSEGVGGARYARDFWKENGDDTRQQDSGLRWRGIAIPRYLPEQPRLYAALERKFAEVDAEVRARIGQNHRCSTCGGTGLLPGSGQ
jgi:hypothetical protein